LTVTEQKAKVKQALEDYKKLDYEDMVGITRRSSALTARQHRSFASPHWQIGDLPTRFKYEKAAPQDYGLTPAEILLATDAELNQFLGMKHYAPYRHGSGVGAAGRGMRDRLKELKATLAKRKWGEMPEEEDASGSRPRDQGWGKKSGEKSSSSGPAKKRKGKKERQREAAAGAPGGDVSVASGSKRKSLADDGERGSSKRQRVWHGSL
jgi:protein KRI1